MKIVTSQILIEELQTDGHSPMKFICNDGKLYYTKYRSGKSLNKAEINCLVFEMVCTRLLQHLQIPTAENALVEIKEDSITPGLLVANKKYLKPGILALGSEEIVNADLVRETELIKKKWEFNRLATPAHLVQIALFDLWVDNVDRHADNYNLLTVLQNGKLEYAAIDHAFSFGGLNGMNTFNARTAVSPYKKLVQSSYFTSVVRHIGKADRRTIVADMMRRIRNLGIPTIVSEVFADVPAAWQINPTLQVRIVSFLQSEERLRSLEQIALQLLMKIKRA